MCRTSEATRKKGKISDAVLNRALKEMQTNDITNACLHTIGDPLANPRLGDVLKEFRTHGRYAALSSNGLLLHRHIDTLLEYMDVSSSIRFSIDGATRETYERIRFGGKWERLLANLDLARDKLQSRCYSITIEMVVSRDNLAEVGLFIEKFREYLRYPAYDFGFHLINSLAPDTRYFESVKLLPNHIHKNIMCPLVAATAPVFHIDGTVSVCCRDYHGDLVIGQVMEQSLSEIRQSDKLRALQTAHEEGDVSDYNLCNNCYVPDGRVDQIFNQMLRYMIHRNPDAPAEVYQRVADDFMDIFSGRDKYREKLEALVN